MTIERAENTPAAPAALAVPQRKPIPLSRPLADADSAWRLAGLLAQSNLLPASLTKNPKTTQGNVTLILLYGAELGLAPMQAIQSIYVVNGRPQMSGQLWLAKVREAGHKVEKLEHTAQKCVVQITRGDTGESWTEEFTIQDAQRAKLDKKDVWVQYPKRMLLWRAVAHCATAICPEVALGFSDADEVVEDESPEQALAHAVDARTTAPETSPTAEADEDVEDAELVDEEALAAADEEARQQVLAMQAEHTGSWPNVATIPGSDQ